MTKIAIDIDDSIDVSRLLTWGDCVVRQAGIEYHGTMTAKLCRNEDDVDIIDELDNEHK